MIAPYLPTNENFRLEALKSLNILDTKSEKEYDDITALAAHLCDTKVALISLVDSDRQWFKSKYGLTISETPRKNSFCAHAILEPEDPLIVTDTREDKRFINNPLTKGKQPIIFYTGIPLIDKEGFALGTLCVIDSSPKKLSEKQLMSLKILGNQIIVLFELNKKNDDLEDIKDKLKKHNQILQNFARVVSHDLKMPLANIITTTDLLKIKLSDNLDEANLDYLSKIKASSFSMNNYINDVLAHYQSYSLKKEESEKFKLNDLLKDIRNLLGIQSDCKIVFPKSNHTINCSKLALKQILVNLIGNSIKYNDKEQIIIKIEFEKDDEFYYFKIVDNGIGIPEDMLDTIFNLFTTANIPDRNGNNGHGIGLSTVKKIVKNMGGVIKATSEKGKNTVFNFSVKK